MYILSQNRHIKFSIINKVSDVLAENLVKIHQNLTFPNNILLELEKINYPSMTLGVPTFFGNKKYSSQQQQRDENINFESDRISSMSGKIQTKQSLLSSKNSGSHKIPSHQTYTRSKLNEYINKLTVPYFNFL